MLEGWTTLAALAVLTTRPRLGLLVGANTFRPPGLTAKLATTLDHLSGGRAILGIGAVIAGGAKMRSALPSSQGGPNWQMFGMIESLVRTQT